MLRLWRTSAGPPLVTFLIIDLAIIFYTSTAGARVNTTAGHAQVLLGTAIDVFLVWRVWRGGVVAWAVLLGLDLLLAALLLGALSTYVIPLFALVLAQVLLLLVPTVRDRIRAAPARRA
jgi:hypothetical protein